MLKSQIMQFLASNPEFEVTKDAGSRVASRYFYNRLSAWMKSKGARTPHINRVGAALTDLGYSWGVTNYPKQVRAILGLRNDTPDYRAYLEGVNAKYAKRILGG